MIKTNQRQKTFWRETHFISIRHFSRVNTSGRRCGEDRVNFNLFYVRLPDAVNALVVRMVVHK